MTTNLGALRTYQRPLDLDIKGPPELQAWVAITGMNLWAAKAPRDYWNVWGTDARMHTQRYYARL